MGADKKEATTKEIIMEAAETEFLEKGFSNAKTTAIAARAKVTHAMLHYYFGTKLNLFQTVFNNKIQFIADHLILKKEQNLTFFEIIEDLIRSHFDFFSQNIRLVTFIYNEMVVSTENRNVLLKILQPKFVSVLAKIEPLMEEEILRGVIHPVKPIYLLLNIVSINITTFMIFPLIKDVYLSDEEYDRLLKERKESNVRFIMHALKK
ncbi:HTH-type transcriptional repressor BepR [termite gut metagenome]|jgi:AcrR family transcriptional regulator|uniref:HTH-type transcriptional repressor BepR n=1 Tax=termite gut metagenome TaxID=433724 RepID=A0A5J4SKD4_9ZZZZ